MPPAAGWIVGTIATLSLLSSVSTFIRHTIRVPREFIDNYLFNFPDTSFAWAFVLALLAGALAARKRIAWWALLINLMIAVAVNVSYLVGGDETRIETAGEISGLTFHLTAIALLLLGYREFWAKVRRGALFKALVALVAGNTIGILLAWGLLVLFPDPWNPDYRFAYAINRVSGFAVADPDLFDGRPNVLLNAIFGLFGALALMAAAVVLFHRNAPRTH